MGRRFQELTGRLTDFKSFSPAGAGVRRIKSPKRISESGRQKLPGPPHVASYTTDWKTKIHEMRMRIEKERTPPGKDDLAIKTGKGGLMDAEFIAQTLCLEHGWQEAHTLRALERARDTRVVPDGDKLIENYRQLRRVEGILRRWSYEGETVLPDDPAPFYRVSVRCGFRSPDEFRQALAKWREDIRSVYENFFAIGTPVSGPAR